METINQLKAKLEKDTAFKDSFTADPLKALEEIRNPPMNDPKIFMKIVYIISGVLALSILVIAGMAFCKQDTPETYSDFFKMLGSISLGALAGLLTPTPRN